MSVGPWFARQRDSLRSPLWYSTTAASWTCWAGRVPRNADTAWIAYARLSPQKAISCLRRSARTRRGGRGFQDYEDVYREIVLQAVDHVKTLVGVDGSRIALAGFSMGGLVSFKVALERSDLRAVALLAPAFGRGLLGEAAKSAENISAPVLVMVEQSDGAPILHGVGILEKALSSRGKPLRLIRYDRGGGHELFYDVGYWWDDLKAFLHEHLAAR